MPAMRSRPEPCPIASTRGRQRAAAPRSPRMTAVTYATTGGAAYPSAAARSKAAESEVVRWVLARTAVASAWCRPRAHATRSAPARASSPAGVRPFPPADQGGNSGPGLRRCGGHQVGAALGHRGERPQTVHGSHPRRRPRAHQWHAAARDGHAVVVQTHRVTHREREGLVGERHAQPNRGRERDGVDTEERDHVDGGSRDAQIGAEAAGRQNRARPRRPAQGREQRRDRGGQRQGHSLTLVVDAPLTGCADLPTMCP